MFKVKPVIENSPVLMRDAYCSALSDLAEKDSRIVALDADLVSSSGMKPFFDKYPDRAIQCGIAEANMIGVACGLSLMGKVPFIHSFGPFVTRRACDQIFISASYAKLNIRILGSDPGVTAAYNGGTHMPFEDMGVLRSIPEITLLEPCDPVAVADIVSQLADLYGVYYMRMARKNVPGVYEAGSSFEIGKGNILRNGCDVTIIASGIMVAEALKAAVMLEEDGVSARVVDMFTWKPMDTQLVLRCAEETGAIVTAENHNIIDGLGSAVSEAVVSTLPVPVNMVGVNDRFGQVGSEDFLRREYGLTAERIAESAKQVIERK